MIDEKLLREAIAESGIKTNHIASCLGHTVQTLGNKISGKTEFTVSEMQTICKLLNLTREKRDKIFFSKV